MCQIKVVVVPDGLVGSAGRRPFATHSLDLSQSSGHPNTMLLKIEAYCISDENEKIGNGWCL